MTDWARGIPPGRSCVVIGAGGFLGTNLCRRLLASGIRVRAFSRHFLFPHELEGADVCQGDFSDRPTLAAAVEGHDVVFHLIQATNLDAATDVQRTLAASLALLEISRSVGVKRVVFVSSGGVIYGPGAPIPTPETAPTEPITAHGISKLAIEKYLALYERLHGLDYRVLRVTNAFGPFQIPRKNLGLVAALISRALADKRVEIWGDGSVVRDYIFVSDVVDALEAAAVDRGDARIFNIGTGQGRSVREVIAAVDAQLAKPLLIDWKPARQGDVPTSVVSIEQAKTYLGWTPKISFEDGVSQTIAWWRSYQ